MSKSQTGIDESINRNGRNRKPVLTKSQTGIDKIANWYSWLWFHQYWFKIH